jgi:hypothetical protein
MQTGSKSKKFKKIFLTSQTDPKSVSESVKIVWVWGNHSSPL